MNTTIFEKTAKVNMKVLCEKRQIVPLSFECQILKLEDSESKRPTVQVGDPFTATSNSHFSKMSIIACSQPFLAQISILSCDSESIKS